MKRCVFMPTKPFFSTHYSKYFGSLFKNLNIEMGEHGYFFGTPKWNFYDAPRYYNRLYFIEDGYGEIRQEDHVTPLMPGNIYLLPSKQNYHFYCPEKLNKFYLHFNINLYHVQDIFLLTGGKILTLPWSPQLAPPFREMEKLENVYSLLPYHNYIYNTIFNFFQFVPEQKLNHIFKFGLKYETVFSYIQNNLRVSLTIKEIAQACRCSEYMLLKKFKSDFGFSLNEHIQRTLLNNVIMQLDMGKSRKEISSELDFCDSHYFSNWFKKKTDHTPSAYQKKLLEVGPFFYKDHLHSKIEN